MRACVRLAAGCLVAILQVSSGASAQTSQSEATARQLVQLMEQRALTSVAAQDPDDPSHFIAAMLFPGHLLVVSARYPVPVLLTGHLAKGDYQEIYQELNLAAAREGKLFVEDLGADGLHASRAPDQPFDIVYEEVVTRTVFDGNWEAQGLSQQQYLERFTAVDRRYASELSLLVRTLKAGT